MLSWSLRGVFLVRKSTLPDPSNTQYSRDSVRMSGSRYAKDTPGICRTQKSTICKRPEDIPKEYEHRKQEGEVVYVEFSGCGLPVDDAGEPGDVWLDTTSGAYALWTMDGASKWINWPGLNDKELVVGGNGPRWAFQSRHPYLEDRFIWVRNRGVVWLTRKDIVKDISIRELTSQQFPIAASVFISQYLEQCAQIPLGSKRRATMDPSDESAAKRARFDKSEPVVLTPVTHSPNESASAALVRSNLNLLSDLPQN